MLKQIEYNDVIILYFALEIIKKYNLLSAESFIHGF
jgi:hypothetical protein